MSNATSIGEQPKIFLMGAVGSGKTSLLSALERCSQSHMLAGTGWDCRIESSDNLKQLHEEFDRILETGRFRHDATKSIAEIRAKLSLSYNPKRLFGREQRWTIDMEVPDYPGGSLYRDAEKLGLQMEKEKLLNFLREVAGLIICLPADAPDVKEVGKTQTEFINDLMSFVRHHNTLPQLQRVVFCITKLDNAQFNDPSGGKSQRIYEYGRRARSIIIQGNVARTLEERLRILGVTKTLLDEIRRRTPGVRFAAGRSSIYGFTKGGSCNYDPDWRGLLIRRHDGEDEIDVFQDTDLLYTEHEVADIWHPYNVFDPFLFAACGELCEFAGGTWSPSDGFIRVFERP